jgi:hypothetical protein
MMKKQTKQAAPRAAPDRCLKWMSDNRYAAAAVIPVAFVIAAMVAYVPPYGIINGDVAQAYKYTLLVGQNPANIFLDTYQKGFHVLSNILTFGFLPYGIGMSLLTALSALLLVFFTYRLAMHFTDDRKVSGIAASLVTIITAAASANFGLFQLPQTLGIALFAAAVYCFVKGRPVVAGLVIALHVTVHASFVFSVLAVLLFFLCGMLSRRQKQKAVLARNFVITAVISAAAYALYGIFFTANAAINIWSIYATKVALDSMISVLSLPVSIFPPMIIFFGLAGCWLMWKEKKSAFIPVLLLATIAASQIYFLDISFLPTSIPNAASRSLHFIGLPLAITTAYAAGRIRSRFLFPAIVVVLLASGAAYAVETGRWSVVMDKADLAAIGELQSYGGYGMVAYRPSSLWGKENTIALLGGKRILYDADFIATNMILMGRYDISQYPVDYMIERSGEGWNVRKVSGSNGTFPGYMLGDYAASMNYIMANNANVAGMNVSFLAEKDFVTVTLGGGRLFAISGDRDSMRELFSSRGVTEFARRLIGLYNMGAIRLSPEIPQVAMLLKALHWVDPLSKYSYPNAVFGWVLS